MGEVGVGLEVLGFESLVRVDYLFVFFVGSWVGVSVWVILHGELFEPIFYFFFCWVGGVLKT